MTMMAIVGVLLLVLALLGEPLFVVIGALGLAAFAAVDIDTQSVIIELYRLAQNPFMITIPLFTFAGFLMAESKTATRLVRLARAGMGWIPGGLALVVLITCAFFTTFTGASGVTIIALGGLLLPALRVEKYPEDFSFGLVTASGSMGLLFPPSLPIILYGLVASVEIDKLFIAGILPGMVSMVVLGGYGMRVAKRAGIKRSPVKAREFLQALNETKWELMVPVIIMVGIYGGFVTVAEASAITAAYVLLIEVFIYKDLDLRRDLPRVIRESMLMVGAILVILGVALGLTNYLVDAQVPMRIFEVMRQYLTSKWAFLMALNLFLLLVGCLLDIFSAIIVVVPLITPVAREVGVDPIHLGIIFLANLQIGYLTPPVGMNLFIASLAFEQPMVRIYRMVLPYLALLVLSLLVITYVPLLSLVLLHPEMLWDSLGALWGAISGVFW